MSSRRIGISSLVRGLGHWYSESLREPAYRQLAAGLRQQILDGRLPLESRLPGERQLAEALQLSRTTVSSALAELRLEGYLTSRHGSGSLTTLPESAPAAPGRESLDFAVAAMPAGPEIHQAYTRALKALAGHLGNTGYEPQGVGELRRAVAEHYRLRGLPTAPEQILIVNGAVSGLALILRALAGPGDRVVIDHPTYPLAIAAIRGASCRPVPVALPDTCGWDVEGLLATVAQTRPRLAYLLPDHHNPTGLCMDPETRRQVAQMAERTRTTVVVDETMLDYWYEQAPPPPLAAWSPEAPIITIGSASKSFWGGLRVGWLRASARTIAVLSRERDSLDLGSPVLEQLAVAHLLRYGGPALELRRTEMRRRRDHLVEHGGRLLPDWRFSKPTGGLACWVELPYPVASMLASSAEIQGVRIGAGPRFGLDGAFERYLRLPFTPDPEDTDRALDRLQAAWLRLDGRAAGRPSGSLI